MRGLTCFLLFLLGLLLLSFVHTALQVLHDVQQLFRGLQEKIQLSVAMTMFHCVSRWRSQVGSLGLNHSTPYKHNSNIKTALLYIMTLQVCCTLKKCMPTNRKSCWKAVFSAVGPFFAFFLRFDTDSSIL